MKKHIHTSMIGIGVLIFLLTLSEIIDMSWEETWGEGFYGSLYYLFMLLGFILFFIGYGWMIKKMTIEEIEKKLTQKLMQNLCSDLCSKILLQIKYL